MSPRIAIVVGSTRPGRKGEQIGLWLHAIALERDDLEADLIDLAEHHLPLFDESSPPMRGDYQQPQTRAWADTVKAYDGYVFVTGEYNHAAPAAVKNAIDFLHAEWVNKAAGFVSYGVDGGVRAVEQLRVVLAPLQVATVAATTSLRLFGDLDADGRPAESRHVRSANAVLDQVAAWSRALMPLRQTATATT